MAEHQGQQPQSSPDEVHSVQPLTIEPQASKVAILGFAGSTLSQAPITDESWEIWGLNQLWMHGIPRWHLWFDLHPFWHTQTDHKHLDWLKQQTKPVLMQDRFPTIPASVPYPREDICRLFGTYFTSSIAWMLAMAIAQKYPTIGIWGVDMLGDGEYEYQRACCDYYIGVARGMGIDVVIPPDSAICRGQDLYGYDHIEPFGARRMRRLRKRQRELVAQKDNALQDLCKLDGAMLEVQEWTQAGHDEDWKNGRMAELTKQREQLLRGVYTIDGALQELGNTQNYEKHYKRGGA